MKKLIKIVCTVLAILAFLCLSIFATNVDKKNEEKANQYVLNLPSINEQALKKEQIIGTTNDDQVVKLVKVEYAYPTCEGCKPRVEEHFIYFVGNSVTVNSLVPDGKNKKIEARATIQE